MSPAFSLWTWPVVCLAMVRTPNAWRAHPCRWAWPCLVQRQIHEAQIPHYCLHSSQALWPAGSKPGYNATRATSEIPRPTSLPMVPETHFGLWGCSPQFGGRCFLHQLFPGASDIDLVPLCVVLPALRIWHHQYFLNGTMQCIKRQREIWVSVLLFDK